MPDILDILIIKSLPFTHVQKPLAELDSDHIPVKITIDSRSVFYRINNTLIKGKPDWNSFSNLIEPNLKIPPSIPTTEIAEYLMNVITEAAQTCSNHVQQNLHNPTTPYHTSYHYLFVVNI